MTRATIHLALLLVACGPATVIPSDDSSTTGTADSAPNGETGGSTSATTVDTSAGDPTTTIDPDAESDDATASVDDGSGFIPPPDENHECDIWIDDCPPGQKCMPWANDGGSAWNATRCTPLAEDPKGVGESCTAVDILDGIDDCEARTMCWDIDLETDMGTCTPMCTGSESNPTCDDPCTSCRLTGEGVLILCLPACDPLAQDCDAGDACYSVDSSGAFQCAPDASGAMGVLGDPCEFINACDPGTFCALPDHVPDEFLQECGGAPGCCTAFCDAAAADPCPQPGLETAECIPWLDEGQAPPCASGLIGACVLPE